MTLGEFFENIGNNPFWICTYFIAIPIIAALAYFYGKGEGHKSPWRELYSALVYAVSIPGIFAITLSFYLFLFERRSILDTNIYTQILPVVSLATTLWLIRKNVSFDQVPGFGKLNALILILAVIMILLWILEKTHILAITIIPFGYFVILMIVLIVVVRFSWKKMTA